MWNQVQSSIQGRGHVKNNIPCQDKTFICEKNGIYVSTLADGAGSAKLSHLGAEAVTKSVAEHMSNFFDEYFNYSPEEARNNIFAVINETLENIVLAHNCEKKELASTLLVVAVKEERFIIMHLGDGVIGCLKNGRIHTISKPENGEFVNSTFFTTSKNADRYLRLFKGDLNGIKGFILFSDGPESSIYNYKSGIISQDLTELFNDLESKEIGVVSKELDNTLEEIRLNTFDDCSIVAMVRSVAEIKPKPAEIKPKPAEIKPEPAEIKPEPAEIKPEPAEIKPEPAEIKPEPARTKFMMITIIFLLLIVIALLVYILFLGNNME